MVRQNNKQNVISVMKQSTVSKLSQFQVIVFEGLKFKLYSENLDFLKILAQIIKRFHNFDKTKNNLIYAKMVKVV